MKASRIVGMAGRLLAPATSRNLANLVAGKESVFFDDAQLAEAGLMVDALRRRDEHVPARGPRERGLLLTQLSSAFIQEKLKSWIRSIEYSSKPVGRVSSTPAMPRAR
jgi:hypothetical protein